jgi:hypothetical protein
MATKTQFWKVGHEGDETLIDGVSPWAQEWQLAGHSAFITKHPGYPNRSFTVRPWQVITKEKTIGFWAGNVKDNVWAFYRSLD